MGNPLGVVDTKMRWPSDSEFRLPDHERPREVVAPGAAALDSIERRRSGSLTAKPAPVAAHHQYVVPVAPHGSG